MIIELNKKSFDSVIAQDGIVLIRCWASWCQSCEEDAEAFRTAAAKFPEHVFSTLDTDAEREICSALNIVHIPCLLLFRDSLLLLKQAGSFDETALDDIVAQAESLSMDEVNAALSSAMEETGAGAP